MPKIRDFKDVAIEFTKELCSNMGVKNISLNFNYSGVINYPIEVSRQEIIFILLTRIAHFIALEIHPNKFEEIKKGSTTLLGTKFLLDSHDINMNLCKYFGELFKIKAWQKRDVTKSNSNNSGKNHLVLLGEHHVSEWYSLKLNRYHRLSNYSLMVSFGSNVIDIYKFGLKH